MTQTRNDEIARILRSREIAAEQNRKLKKLSKPGTLSNTYCRPATWPKSLRLEK